MMTTARATLPLLATALIGCHLVLPYTGRAGEAPPPPRDGLEDAGAARDGPALRLDQTKQTDGEPADWTEIGPSPDTFHSVETGPILSPCSPGFAASEISYDKDSNAKKVICASTSVVLTQCQAGAACNTNAGWHLCTKTEFLAREGQSTPTQVKAWLAGCIREGGIPTNPKDGPCSSCAPSAQNGEASWPCGLPGMALAISSKNVGLRANSACRRVGTNTAANDGMWEAAAAETLLLAALCCN